MKWEKQWIKNLNSMKMNNSIKLALETKNSNKIERHAF
jgi:hypothetical protein